MNFSTNLDYETKYFANVIIPLHCYVIAFHCNKLKVVA